MPPDDSLDLFPQAPGSPARGPGSSGDARPASPPTGSEPPAPLADRMRPRDFDEIAGQEHLLGEGRSLRALLASGELPSLILWGPPGSGKTTLARLLAASPQVRIEERSAVIAGVKEIRASVERARHERRAGVRTLLFIDEIHRLNRAQQDVLLPHVEQGTVTLVGATTENPSFEVNAPLLSRCRVLVLEPLGEEALVRIIERAIDDPVRGLGAKAAPLSPEALDAILGAADGDARRALGLLEAAAALHARSGAGGPIRPEDVREASGRRMLAHDRDREEHYNVVSALIKSVRASDPDAALYYLARMLDAGEDPIFVARRLVILASEDIGNADPNALTLATSAFLATERIGMPEARIPLAQATTYLACAPKSNAAYAALARASAAIDETGSLAVPMHLRNAPTGLMRSLGYGEGYRYPHDQKEEIVPDANLPAEIAERRFYEPKPAGEEIEIGKRLAAWRAARKPR